MSSAAHETAVLGEIEQLDLSGELISGHLELARNLAHRYAGRGEPVEELVQVAMLGLVRAAKRYDPERGNGFVPFAVPTILGELRRYFRDQCWAVRIPRPLHDLYREILSVREELTADLGRSPRPRELADALNVTEDQILQALECSTAYSAMSLDSPESESEESGRTLGETIGAEDTELDLIERREAVRQALAQVPPRQRRILILRFYGERTQAEIAEELGISQMHVSRLLSSTLELLRSAIQEDRSEPIRWPVPRTRRQAA